MDYPGFGFSESLHGYIPSFDKLVDDVIEHYSKVKEKPEFRNLPSFLFRESVGGAIDSKVHQKQPNAWNGAVLVAPMCKIADNMVPPWLVTLISWCRKVSSNTGFRRVGSQRCKEERTRGYLFVFCNKYARKGNRF